MNFWLVDSPLKFLHLWIIQLDQKIWIEHHIQSLSVKELERARAFHFEQDRTSFINARGTMRSILGKTLSEHPSSFIFSYSPHGKPYLKEYAHIEFNLSHSGTFGLFALQLEGKKVGIDIEKIRPLNDLKDVARNFFSKTEVDKLMSTPKEIQLEAFYNCWTRKEAFIKAKGGGLSIPLDQFEVSFLPGENPKLINIDWDPTEIEKWELNSLKVPRGYKAAVVVEK
jgi:4'-phosphopantetheinyl transferase